MPDEIDLTTDGDEFVGSCSNIKNEMGIVRELSPLCGKP